MSVPRHDYTPKFKTKLFNKDYRTLQKKLGYNVDDKCDLYSHLSRQMDTRFEHLKLQPIQSIAELTV